MNPTHQRTLREAIASAVAAIAPEDHNLPEFPWNRVFQIKDVPGGVRNFFVRLLPADSISENGNVGSGWEVDATIQIWASYKGLPDDEDGPTIDDDQRQIYLALVDLVDPLTDGLSPVLHSGWVFEEEAAGHVWGFHSFRMRYLVADE